MRRLRPSSSQSRGAIPYFSTYSIGIIPSEFIREENPRVYISNKSVQLIYGQHFGILTSRVVYSVNQIKL